MSLLGDGGSLCAPITLKNPDCSRVFSVVFFVWREVLRGILCCFIHPVPHSLQVGDRRQIFHTLDCALSVHDDALNHVSQQFTLIYLRKRFGLSLQQIKFIVHADYELFWHHAGKYFSETLKGESLFIFWMERYLALSEMETDDLQGRAWLDELQRSPARRMLAQSLMPPAIPILPEEDQQQISKLLPSLLHEQGAPLQKQFLQLLMHR